MSTARRQKGDGISSTKNPITVTFRPHNEVPEKCETCATGGFLRITAPNKFEFETFEIRGTGASSSRELEVPYGGSDPSKPYYIYRDNKTVLKGQALLDQLKRWVARGTIEQGAADAIRWGRGGA